MRTDSGRSCRTARPWLRRRRAGPPFDDRARRQREEAVGQSGDARLAVRRKRRERVALERMLNPRGPVDFLATRACPECGEVVGAEHARAAEEARAAWVEKAHRMHGHRMMTAFFERDPIPLRCAGCGALVGLDHRSPELRRLTESEADLFRAEFPNQCGPS